MSSIAGVAGAAIGSLTPEQLNFIGRLPKAELHAHLNGSIPISVLQELAHENISLLPSNSQITDEGIKKSIQLLIQGPSLVELHDFFDLFPAIYALTSTTPALARATRAVLSHFLDGDRPQCLYLELRTTPRESPSMSREQYLNAVLDEIEKYRNDQARLIVSLDRRMTDDILSECLGLALRLKQQGRRVVGIDLCGDPTAGNLDSFKPICERAKAGGLGITLHVAETVYNSAEETLKFLAFKPDRLGHATFLNEEARGIVLQNKTCIEICLTSNLICKTVETLESHHIRHYLQEGHPIAICTDDILPFHTTLEAEYALLLAKPPFGLGLTEGEVTAIGQMSLRARFGDVDEA